MLNSRFGNTVSIFFQGKRKSTHHGLTIPKFIVFFWVIVRVVGEELF